MGTHGRRGLRRMVIGSVAERFVRYATCPVLFDPRDGGYGAPHIGLMHVTRRFQPINGGHP